MTQLQQAHHFLMASLQTDPLFKIAHAVSFFDPLWCDGDFYEEDPFATALHICRRTFPDLYVEALQALRKGHDVAYVEHIICDDITALGIPLDHIEYMGWGIPLPAYGVELDDPEFYTTHPNAKPILECFGISTEVNPYHITVPECAYTAGSYIAIDLQHHANECFRQIGWLMHWLFSSSGNSSVDYDYETICEFEPLSWEADDLTFAVEIIKEADIIMADALAGMAFLTSQPELMKTLQHNVHRIYKAMDRRKGKRDEPKVKLKWTDYSSM
jgi:hypothetical protein